MQRVAKAEMVEQNLGVSADHSKQIVEVVSDAAGEAADSLHFLRLAELVFQHAALGDVFGDGFQDIGGFVASGYGAAADANRDDDAVLPFPADFEAVHASGAPEFVDQSIVFGGIDEDVFLRIKREDFESVVVAEHSDQGGIDVEKTAFEAGAVDPIDGGLHQRAVTDLGTAQSLLVAFAVDGGGQLLRDESENIRIALAEANVLGIALENKRTQDATIDLERDP